MRTIRSTSVAAPLGAVGRAGEHQHASALGARSPPAPPARRRTTPVRRWWRTCRPCIGVDAPRQRQRAHRGGSWRQADQRASAAGSGPSPARCARCGCSTGSRRRRRPRGQAGGMGDGQRDPVADRRASCARCMPPEPGGPLPVAGLGLGPPGDAVHRLDHGDRVVPDRGLGRQHQRVGAVEHGVGDVADLGAGGRRRRDHALHHLRGGDDRHAASTQWRMIALLQVRHVLQRALDAEVAAGDHHRVGLGDDLVEVGDGAASSRSSRPAAARCGAMASRTIAQVVRRRARTTPPGSRRRPRPSPRRARRSSSVGVVSRSRSDGRCTPGRPCTRPPVEHACTLVGRPSRSTRSEMAPSPSTTRSPAREVVEQRRVVDVMRAGVAGPSPARTPGSALPPTSSTPPSGKWPARTFGPGRSASTATPGRRARRRRARRARRSEVLVERAVAEVQAHHVDAGAQQSSSTSGASLAGPRVATIFVRVS